MHPSIVPHVTAARRLLGRVAAAAPEAVHFNPDGYAEKQVALYLATRRYDNFLHFFGVRFTLALLRELERLEDYDACAGLAAAVRAYNELARTDFPTRYDDLLPCHDPTPPVPLVGAGR